MLSKILILVCLSPFALVPAAKADSAPEPWPVTETAPGVFVRPGVHELMKASNAGAIATIGFVVGEEGVAVIDSGGSRRDGACLRAALRRHTDLPIRYVINTHVHPDHIFGNSAFLADRPAFVGHHKLPRAMAARGAHYLAANRALLGDAAFEGTEIVAPTVLVEDRLTLDLGGRRLFLTAHPTAHTDNDLTVFDEETGTLWTGDLLFDGHIPVLDGSLNGWLQVMQDLAAKPAERVVPGHGAVQAAWPHALEKQQALPGKARCGPTAHDHRRCRDPAGGRKSCGISAGTDWELFEEFNLTQCHRRLCGTGMGIARPDLRRTSVRVAPRGQIVISSPPAVSPAFLREFRIMQCARAKTAETYDKPGFFAP